MRILDRLYCRGKIVFFSLFSLFSLQAWGELISSPEQLLAQAKNESSEYQKIKAQVAVDQLAADSLLALYSWSLSGGASLSDGEQPATSPFSPSGDTTAKNVQLKLEKNSVVGINPFVALNTDKNQFSFPGRGELDFSKASIEAGVRVDLLKAFYAKSSLNLFKQSDRAKEIAEISARIAERNFEDKVMRGYYKLLRSIKKLEVLERQCGEYKILQNIIKNRYKRKLVQEKDFLLVEVLYQDCSLSLSLLKNTKESDELVLKKIAGLKEAANLNFVKQSFPKENSALPTKSSGRNLDLALAQKVVDLNQTKVTSLKANEFPKFDFTYSLVSQASDDTMLSSLNESTSMELLTHKFGLNFQYNFGSSTRKLALEQSLAETEVKNLELVYFKQSLERDQKNLERSFKYLKEACEKAQRISGLQKRKAFLHNREYKNGRGSARNLVEAEVAYIRSSDAEIDYKYSLALHLLDAQKVAGN